jgi:hypothetical protein
MRKTRGRCISSFFHIEDKRPLCGPSVGPAKHPSTSRRETIAGLSLPPCHTLHTKKATFSTRLASFSSLSYTEKKKKKKSPCYQSEKCHTTSHRRMAKKGT